MSLHWYLRSAMNHPSTGRCRRTLRCGLYRNLNHCSIERLHLTRSAGCRKTRPSFTDGRFNSPSALHFFRFATSTEYTSPCPRALVQRKAQLMPLLCHAARATTPPATFGSAFLSGAVIQPCRTAHAPPSSVATQSSLRRDVKSNASTPTDGRRQDTASASLPRSRYASGGNSESLSVVTSIPCHPCLNRPSP